MSFFPLPTKVANHIEKLRRNFLWGGLGEEFKYYLIRWFKVCTPIFGGGLGIRNLMRFNHAFLGKWSWHYRLEREACGEWWWTLNMEVHGEGDALGSLLGRMGWGYGKIL